MFDELLVIFSRFEFKTEAIWVVSSQGGRRHVGTSADLLWIVCPPSSDDHVSIENHGPDYVGSYRFGIRISSPEQAKSRN